MKASYLQIVKNMPDREQNIVRSTMGFPPGDIEKHLNSHEQYEVVLALLRADELIPAVLLVGRPITVFDPDTRLRLRPFEQPPSVGLSPDDRIIRSVARNPRLPTTGAALRFREFRKGRTLAQCLARGVTRRDIRQAIDRRWVRL